MPTVVQFRRGTTAQNDAFTGAVGEISVDTDKDTLRVHDGSTAGGFEVLTANATQTITNKTPNQSWVPAADSAYDLGSASFKWKDLYLSGNTIYLGDALIHSTGTAVRLPVGSVIGAAGGALLDSALARQAFSVTDNGGDGSLTYDAGTGVITYTGPSASEVRAHFSGGTGIDISSGVVSTVDGQIVHDNLSGFVADEHVAHSSVTITAGSGLTGGGTIAASRTINIGQGTGITVSADAISTNDAQIVHDNLSGFVADEHVAHSGVTLTAGAGLTGGGTIAASRTFNVGAGTGVTVSADAVSIGQDVATTADVTFATVTTTGNVVVGGNLQVTGTTTTVNSQDLNVTDNMIYMNAGESSGSPTLSIDVGWAANVNDNGSYTHVGMFRDATDDRFKVFGAYTPEPDAALEINTGHASFALADFQASTFHGNLSGNVTGNVTGNASTATALQTARTIGGVSFDGTANINLPGVNTAGNQNTSGNAATATKWATGRTITLTGDVTGVSGSFDGSGNLSFSTSIAANTITSTELSGATSLVIYNSAGTALKTLYGAGS